VQHVDRDHPVEHEEEDPVTKFKVWASVLTAGATVGLVAYAVSRRTGHCPVAQPLANDEASQPARASALNLPAPRQSIVADLAPTLPARKLEAVAPDSDVEPTVQCLMKAPALVGSDDAEALDPDDLGGDWLARAAQSERSVRESDLEVPLEELADATLDATPYDATLDPDAGEDLETDEA
jgi:hypothetical protein